MLHLDHVSFAYDEIPVLEDISLKVQRGEHVAIIGESGCGKSTLLRIIYGLLQVKAGEIYWCENRILGPLFNLVAGEGYMKYLSQDFDLMPFTSVYENVSQYLSVFEPEQLKQRTYELLAMIEMTEFAQTKVKNLSGGQQQRVALARVLAQKPEVLLLDEPFSHIDNSRKNGLRRNLFPYLKKENITLLTATHDHNDILPFADNVVVLRGAKIIAKDTPKNLYDNPKDLYVASLFGEANRIRVNGLKTFTGPKHPIIVYAHEFRVSGTSGLEALVVESYFMGGHYLIKVIFDGQDVYFQHYRPFEEGKKVYLNITTDTIEQRMVHH